MQLLNSSGEIVDTGVVDVGVEAVDVVDVEFCPLEAGPSKTKPSARAISIGPLSEFYKVFHISLNKFITQS